MCHELKSILASWGLQGDLEIKEEAIFYETEREAHIWTVNENYILKMTQTEEEIVNNTTLLNLLQKATIKTQQVVCTTDGASYISSEGRYYGLYTKIKGEVLKDYFEGDYLARGSYLGECIARLHKGLDSITEDLKHYHDVWDNNMVEELAGWGSNELENYMHISQVEKDELEGFNHIKFDLEQNFETLYQALPRQVIHRDMHGENLIFNEGELVGYIDFDLSQMNARLFDICYLGTGSLAGVFSDQDKREKWVPFMKAVMSGYDAKNLLTDAEIQSVKYMMIAIEFIMIAFFTRDGYLDIADVNMRMVHYIDRVWE